MLGTLIVNYINLNSAIKDMFDIANELENRDLNISFSNSKGEMADKYIESAKELQQFGKACGALIETVAFKLAFARDSFKEMDTDISNIAKNIQ